MTPAFFSRNKRWQRTFFAAAVLVGLFAAVPIRAATFTVNSTNDAVDASPGNGVCATSGGVCTLRAAIQEANALAGTHTINVPAGTYTLTITGTGENAAATGDLDITKSVTIAGAGAGSTIIRAGTTTSNGIDRVFEITSTTAVVTISDVTIQNGRPGAANGGGIRNVGNLTLTNVIVTGNTTTGSLGGGAISSEGSSSSTTLANVTLSNNTASGHDGGGFYNEGTANLTDVTISGNTAGDTGGGIKGNAASSNLTLARVTINGNTAANGGGGIENDGTLAVTNATLSGNSTTGGAGGGVEVQGGPATLTNVTITANSAPTGGGISRSASTATLKNTIVANNTSGGNCFGTISSAGNNLDSANTCLFTGPGDKINTNPSLGALANNGGPTQTHALLAGSPAIDAGTNGGCPATDQRGYARPVNGTCDIGAYEFGAAAPVTLSGTVFEDMNYGGGAGRSQVTSGGSGRSAARVELYNSSGAFVTFTTTDAVGGYSFTNQSANATYTVRVVNSTVTSSRTGFIAGLLPVQTFRVNGLSGNAGVADPTRVGGERPDSVDAGNGAAGTTMNAATGAFTAGITGQAESITTFAVGTSNVTGLDFGFNFDTIVNVNDSGQGSLRQFIINSNALSNTGLAQAGQAAGKEVTIFMIPDGTAHPGLRAGLANQLTGGVAVITPATALPAITDADTAIDGGTQTTNVGDTNGGVLGTGGTVGVDNLTLSQVNRPEVQIQNTATVPSKIGLGLDVQANNATIRNISILGFGNQNATTDANIRIGNNFTGTLIEKNVIGTSATSFADPGAGIRTGGHSIVSNGGDSGTIQNNLIGFADQMGILLTSTSNGWLVQNNELRSNGLTNTAPFTLDGLSVEGSSGTATIQGNLSINNGANGIEIIGNSNTITNNTVMGNGIKGTETPGIRVLGTSTLISRNIIRDNLGAGVAIRQPSSNGNTISQNSIFNNGAASGQIGIDLLNATDNAQSGTAPYVTLNDAGDADAGGNDLFNYAVIATATIGGGSLTLSGFARPGSRIEFFIAAPDPSGFGEGQTYLFTSTEGCASVSVTCAAVDGDATTGTYGPGAVNGILQGTDTTNRFSFTVPLPAGVVVGTQLTATATCVASDGCSAAASGSTSEFSGNVAVAVGATVSGTVYNDVNHNATLDAAETGTGLTLYAKLISGGTTQQIVAVVPAAGGYTFTGVVAGNYTIIIDDNNNAADVTPTVPAGWIGTEIPNQTRSLTVGSTVIAGQNFGLFNGSKVAGTVFSDNGNPSGTANDGVQNGAESGIAAVTVKVTNNAGTTTFDSAATDGGGNYTLWIPASAGNNPLKVVEANAGGFVSTGGSAGTTGGTYNRSTDTTTFTNAVGTSYSGVNFADVPQNMFTTDGTQTGLPGTTVFYTHSFIAGSGGTVTFTAPAVATPNVAGWNNLIYRDTNCNGVLDGTEGNTPLTTAVAVLAGDKICIVVKEFIPAGAPYNAQDQITVTANFNYGNAGPALAATYTHTDLTIVGNPAGAGLVLQKTVRNVTTGGAAGTSNAARPGETLEYTIGYSNNSADPLVAIVINDTTPAFTVFVSAGCGAPLPANITACNVSTQPAVGSAGAIVWTLTGSLVPSASGTVIFRVNLQ